MAKHEPHVRAVTRTVYVTRTPLYHEYDDVATAYAAVAEHILQRSRSQRWSGHRPLPYGPAYAKLSRRLARFLQFVDERTTAAGQPIDELKRVVEGFFQRVQETAEKLDDERRKYWNKRACREDHECRRCGKVTAECFEINARTDIRYQCRECGESWCVDGPDA